MIFQLPGRGDCFSIFLGHAQVPGQAASSLTPRATIRSDPSGRLALGRASCRTLAALSRRSEASDRFVEGMIMEGLQTTAPDSSSGADQKFHFLANSLAKLLDTARRELERDRDAAKASLVTASHILQAEIERCSGANGSTRGGLAAWQIVRVRAYIDSNLHRTIHIRDLGAVARRTPRTSHGSSNWLLASRHTPTW